MDNYKKSIFLLASFFFFACSSDSSNGGSPEEEIPVTDSFSFFVNGTDTGKKFTTVMKDGNTMHLGYDGHSDVIISFDKNGNFGRVYYKQYFSGGNPKSFYSHQDFSSNYFNFNLESLDEVHKRVKASYSGYINYDSSDLNSEGKFVNGSFDLPYEDYIPAVANIRNEALINNVPWRATNKYITKISDVVTINNVSDDAYRIAVVFNRGTTLAGTYNFSSASTINKVQFGLYNTATMSYTNYICTGQLTITKIWLNFVEGTYNLTAVNPNNSADVITISNGQFKQVYPQY